MNPLTFREALREMNTAEEIQRGPRKEAWGHLTGDSGLQKERAAALAPQTPCPGQRCGQGGAKWNFLNEGPGQTPLLPKSRGRIGYLYKLTERHSRLTCHFSFLKPPQVHTEITNRNVVRT